MRAARHTGTTASQLTGRLGAMLDRRDGRNGDRRGQDADGDAGRGHGGAGRRPIHVITVNDYLVQRDAELMRPLYSALGLSVGIVIAAAKDAAERRAAYACDITYCTNKELAFDYLRDRMVLGQSAGDLTLKMEALLDRSPRRSGVAPARPAFRPRRRGRQRADRRGQNAAHHFRQRPDPKSTRTRSHRALELAAMLEAGEDYILDLEERRVFLTAHGQDRVTAFAAGPWTAVAQRHHPRGTRQAGPGGDSSVPERRPIRRASKTRCRSSTNIPAASCPTGSGAMACTR